MRPATTRRIELARGETPRVAAVPAPVWRDRADDRPPPPPEARAPAEAEGADVALAWIRIQILDTGMSPLASQPYRLEVAGGNRAGMTSGDGVLTERVPAAARDGRLWIGDDDRIEIRLRFGVLEPVEQANGVTFRLPGRVRLSGRGPRPMAALPVG